jgi:magnesium and cobalt transporter
MVAHFNPHTRFPIRESRESPNTLGYVNFKEMVFLMRANPKNPSLLGILRPLPKFAAETPADDVLQTFIATHSHMGLVEDGSGKVLGLVTLEDVMEVLVGEIGEELDLPPASIHDLGGGSFLIGGGAKLGEVLQATGKSLSGDPKETLSDWLLGRFKGIPRVGDVYREKDIEFLVRRVRRGKVFEVCLQPGEESHLAGVPPAPPAPGS